MTLQSSGPISATNIAAEFDDTSPTQISEFYKICFDSKKWEKWVKSDFDINDKHKLKNVFKIVRFGNVINSDGSVLPIKMR